MTHKSGSEKHGGQKAAIRATGEPPLASAPASSVRPAHPDSRHRAQSAATERNHRPLSAIIGR